MNIFKQKTPARMMQFQAELEDHLRDSSRRPVEDLFQKLETSDRGISRAEAEERLEKSGENVIAVGRKNTIWKRFREALINPFNIILLVIAIITYITDVALATEPDYLTVIIIVALVLLSSLVAFIQGERSNSAAESLTQMVSNRADVWRDGELIEIPINEVVPGDLVKLSAGDMIPADVRFLQAKDTFVTQSALTGESQPVEKYAELRTDETMSVTDLDTIGLMGTNVLSGSATALVLETGNSTYFGSMAKTLSDDRGQTSFERGVSAVSRLLVRMMIVMVPTIFLVNGLTKGDWPNALLFAISVAVGLTPQLLPVIMTSTLAIGALNMSKRKVIVRQLGAIQTFGEMDVLCTDKTGTLTEDKIILEKYMDVHGEDDSRVLRHAYLNSYFQTGLKNLIDLAIINRARENEVDQVKDRYSRIDEIPFDFERRRMSVVVQDKSGKRQLITKGAVEEIMGICSYVELHGVVQSLDDETRRQAIAVYEKHNRDGLRILAVAQKNEVPDVDVFSVSDEKDMVLIGFVGFLDPPKENVDKAIDVLKEHGVRTVVLTGDSEGVAIKVCNKVGVDTSHVLTGVEVEDMSDEDLSEAVKTCDLFAKLSPLQKERVVAAFQKNGHTVGYMGDGINDAPALSQSDVGISVDNAVDIAKETADIILLEKDLMVLEEGVISGRRTFGNISKYIKMATSGNLGNMIAVLLASIFLPFLPMLPVQILTQNLLNDFAQLGMPFDRMDDDYVKLPRKWETGSIKSFMFYMGPLSSLFDILCFAIMWWIFGWQTPLTAPLFHAGWFLFGTVSQILVIHSIRTAKVPFFQSMPSRPLVLSTLLVTIVAFAVAMTDAARGIELATLPLAYLPWLFLLLVGYFLTAHLMKRIYIKKYGYWI
ncbi:MAG: magnesium-translocating P-type ATPase [Fastidiosipilaceae bacterium]